MTQNDRVLARLRLGPVAAVEFQPPAVCDGGAPIWRVAARIDVLKSRGHHIVSERLANGTAVYRLIEELPKPSGERPTGIAQRRADPCQGVAAPSQTGTHPSADAGVVRPPVMGSLFDPDAFAERGGYRDAA